MDKAGTSPYVKLGHNFRAACAPLLRLSENPVSCDLDQQEPQRTPSHASIEKHAAKVR